MLIARLSLLIAIKPPIEWNVGARNPLWGDSLAFENDERWNSGSINANCFNRCHPFLPTRLRLILLLYFLIDNHSRGLNFTNGKSAFVHVINVLKVDVIEFSDRAKCLEPFF